MTELSPTSHVTPFDKIKNGSAGMLLPNLECKVSVAPKKAKKKLLMNNILFSVFSNACSPL